MADLERARRQHARVVQRLPNSTGQPAVLAPLGWLSMNAYISQLKITFLWRVLNLPDRNIYKCVVLHVLDRCFQCENETQLGIGLVQDMYRAVCSYDIKDELSKCVALNNYGDIEERKCWIKRRIREYELYSWKASCLMYPSLNIYRETVEDIRMHTWWSYADKFPHSMGNVSTVMSLLLGAEPKGSHEKCYGRRACDLCKKCYDQDAKHTLFQCSFGIKM